MNSSPSSKLSSVRWPTLPAIRAEKARRAAEAQRRDVERNAEAIRQRCKTFSGFVREAWHVLEPGTELKWSWHLDAICDHLEAITFGRLAPWLIINVPPGSSKSMIVSVLWQAWEWGPVGNRWARFLSTSFELENVKRDTRKSRDLIKSAWYQALWPEVSLTRDGETSFANTDMGSREGVAFASITGKRGDRVIVDDPHSLDGAESEAERTRSTRRFLEGGLNRVNDQSRSAIVVVMQRLHEADLAGVLLARKLGFIHLMIPMEFEPDRRCVTPLPWKDPREADGDLMDPVRMPRPAVERLKSVGAYSWAGQYQQRPAPREGGLFKRRWFEIVGAAPAGIRRVRKWDLAASTRSTADFTVGLLMSRDPTGLFYVEDVIRFRGSPGEVETAILNTASADGRATEIHLNEDPGQAGKAQSAYLTRALAGFIVKAERETGSKETRAEPFAAQAEAGNVRLVRGAWNEPYLDELCNFPSATHDDQVDASSGAFNHLAQKVRLSFASI